MGVTIAVARAAADIDAPPYVQDITTPDLGGLTPVGAFFTITYCTADGTPAVDAELGFGACDGTREWAVSANSEDGVGTTDTSRCSSDSAVIKLLFPGSASSFDCEAEFSTFITNGVRINWTNAPAGAYLITVKFIAGTDASCYANNFALAEAIGNSIDVNVVGFEPDYVLFTSVGIDSGAVANATECNLSLGAVVNDGANSQACWAVQSRNGQAAATVSSQITNSYATGNLNEDGSGSWDWTGEIGTFDANGFTCTTRESGSSADIAFYFAVKVDGVVDVSLDVIDTPTATGDDLQTDPGFIPQFVMCGLTQMPAIDTAYTDGNAGSIGLTMFDRDDAFCNSTQDEDGEGTTDTQSLSNDQVVDFPLDDGAAAHVAVFTNFIVNGWEWNFSDTEGTAKKWWSLAVGANRIPRYGFTNFQIPGIV